MDFIISKSFSFFLVIMHRKTLHLKRHLGLCHLFWDKALVLSRFCKHEKAEEASEKQEM